MGGGVDGDKNVRRPLDALTLPDDSYATISLLSGGGLKNTSVASGRASNNANILIQSLSFAVSEKHQRAQTFDRDRLFFFGQALPSLKVSAKTLDTLTFQWLQEIYENYAACLGGSVAAEKGAKVQITSDDRVYTGYILDLNFSKNAASRYMADISFSMALTNLKHLKKLRSTVDEKDLAQIDITSALQGVSDILRDAAREPSAGVDLGNQVADPGIPLSEVAASSSSGVEALDFTKGSYAFKDIYPNEYPNRSYGILTEKSFVTEPVAPEQAKLPDSLAEQIEGQFEDILDFKDQYGVGVTVLRTGHDGVSLEDIENPFIVPTPAVTTGSVMGGANITDAVPSDSTLGGLAPVPPPSSFAV